MQREVVSPSGRPLFDLGLEDLAQFVAKGPVIGFDFDGTLAPLAGSPRLVRMREGTAVLLKRVCELHPCVVISGRERADVARRLHGLPLRQIIGNHGAEAADLPLEPPPNLRCWAADLEERLETLLGTLIEDKHYSLTVHYRTCADREAARERILEVAESFTGARVVEGILCVNLLPESYPNKGSALLRAAEGLADGSQVPPAIFIGDDVTDEDAFTVAPDRVFGIRIGEGRSAARYHLRNQVELDLLLSRLVALAEARLH